MSTKIIEFDKDKPNHLIIKYALNKTDVVQPMLELFKGKLFSSLHKSFMNNCINAFGTSIFSIKKSYTRTLTNILSTWIFSLYINYDYSADYFFPSNYNNTQLLENILFDLCKYDKTINEVDNKINIIITKLKESYKEKLELLDSYKNGLLFKNNKDNYKIKKKYIILKNQSFYKFDFSVNFIIKDNIIINILNNIFIPINVYDKMLLNYSGLIEKIDDYIWAIIFRYQLLGSNNHQLAVLPSIMERMTIDYNLNFECFASSINTMHKNYCSIYYDLEKYFGSVGSFFNIEPIKGTFGFNPPYQKDIIEQGIHKIFNYLQVNEELIFIITIPIWDSVGKAQMKELYNNELKKQNIEYGDFTIVNEIKNSIFFKYLKMIPKEKFTYVDHNFQLYKNKTIQNTYVILLSNCNVDISYLENYIFEQDT